MIMVTVARASVGPVRAALVDGEIVDQPDFAQPCSGQYDEIVAAWRRLGERLGIAHRKVLRPEPGRLQPGHAAVLDRRQGQLAGFDRSRAFAQRPMQLRRSGAFFGREEAVAGTHRQPVVFTHRRRSHDLQRQAQIPRHAADHDDLLIVLLPEHREVGLNHVEQLGHDGRHANEMSGPELPAQDGRQSGHLHARTLALTARIHLLDAGCEHQRDPLRRQRGVVLFGRARVGRVVFLGAELQRVDEDADDHGVGALTAGAVDQA